MLTVHFKFEATVSGRWVAAIFISPNEIWSSFTLFLLFVLGSMYRHRFDHREWFDADRAADTDVGKCINTPSWSKSDWQRFSCPFDLILDHPGILYRSLPVFVCSLEAFLSTKDCLTISPSCCLEAFLIEILSLIRLWQAKDEAQGFYLIYGI